MKTSRKERRNHVAESEHPQARSPQENGGARHGFRARSDDSRMRRHVTRLGPFSGKPQEIPEPGPRRLRECRWEPCAKLTIPEDWPSGVYLGKLTAEREKVESYVIFVVRDNRAADVMVQVSDTTWQ